MRRRRRDDRSGDHGESLYLFPFGEAEEREYGDRQGAVEQLTDALVVGGGEGARANLFSAASLEKTMRVSFGPTRS